MSGVVAVLSGGGAKAAAHLGALRALDEAGLAPSRFVATSMGAVLAAAVAAGRPLAELRASLAGVRAPRRRPLLALRGLLAPSLLDPGALRALVERLVPARRFADLVHPLTVTACDADRGGELRFGAGGEDAPLLDVLCATCALPPFFPPVAIGARRAFDGGIACPLPLAAAAGMPASLVVAVDVGPGFDEGQEGTPPALPPLVAASDAAVGFLMARATAAARAAWPPAAPPLLYVRPRVERGATFRSDLVARFERDGHAATAAALAARGGST